MAKVCKQEEGDEVKENCIEDTTAWWPLSAVQIFAKNSRALEVCNLFNDPLCTKDAWTCDVCVSNVETFVKTLLGNDANIVDKWYQDLKEELKGAS